MKNSKVTVNNFLAYFIFATNVKKSRAIISLEARERTCNGHFEYRIHTVHDLYILILMYDMKYQPLTQNTYNYDTIRYGRFVRSKPDEMASLI